MARTGSTICLAAYVLSSCAPDPTLFLEPPAGARSAIIAKVHEAAVSLDAVPIADAGVSFESALPWPSTGLVTTVLFFEESLDALGVVEGRLRTHSAPEGRLLPVFRDAFFTRIGVDGPGEWSKLTELEPPLSVVRIDAFDPVACVRRGGCLDPTGPNEICVAPCPEPEPPAPPKPPALPELPRLPIAQSCEGAWRSAPVDFETGSFCVPVSRRACAGTDAQFFGEAGCRRVGVACTTTGWPLSTPPGRPLIHVRAGAVGPADGSTDAPFASIRDALGAATSDSVIVLAAGRHATEPITLEGQVEIVGACAAETVISSTTAVGPDVPLVSARGRENALVEVALEAPGVAIESTAATLRLTHVRAEAHGLAVIRVRSGSARGEAVVLRGSALVGVDVSGGARSDFDRLVVEAASRALVVDEGAVATASRSAFAGAVATATSTPLIVVENGAHLELAEFHVEDGQRAIWIGGASTASIADGFVAGRLNVAGPGIEAVYGSRLHLVRTAVYARGRNGVLVGGTGAEAVLADVLIQDVRTTPEDSGGGVRVVRGASVDLDRCLVVRPSGVGVYVADPSTQAVLDDVAVLDTGADRDHHPGAISIEYAARLIGRRIRIERAPLFGLGLSGQAMGEVQDLTVERIDEPTLGLGVHVIGSAHLTLRRAQVRDCGLACIAMGNTEDQTSLEDLDLSSCGGAGLASDGDFHRLRRVRVSAVPNVGVKLTGRSNSILEDVSIAAGGPGSSTGLRIGGEAVVRAARFSITGATGTAIEVPWEIGTETVNVDARLSQGRVASSAVGLRVGASRFDLRPLLDRVRFEDNGVAVVVDSDL